MKKLFSISCLMTSMCFALTLAPVKSEAQNRTKGGTGKEVYTGTIFYFPGPTVGGPGRSRTATRTFTLTLNCTTSRGDFNRLESILKSDGQDGLLRAIGKEKCGRIQVGTGVGRDVNTVIVTNTEEGDRKIIMLFERWLEFFEVRYGTRSRDYPFTYMELFVNNKGKLEGTMIPAAKVRFIGENNTVEIENFAAYPARVVGNQRNR